MPDATELGKQLRLDQLERRGKRVYKLPGFDDTVKVRKLTIRELSDLILIEDGITKGHDLSRFYRGSDTPDELLRKHAVLHLHLGGKSSNALLYLMQFSEQVLLICVGGHGLVSTVPVGANLPQYKIRNWISRMFPK